MSTFFLRASSSICWRSSAILTFWTRSVCFRDRFCWLLSIYCMSFFIFKIVSFYFLIVMSRAYRSWTSSRFSCPRSALCLSLTPWLSSKPFNSSFCLCSRFTSLPSSLFSCTNSGPPATYSLFSTCTVFSNSPIKDFISFFSSSSLATLRLYFLYFPWTSPSSIRMFFLSTSYCARGMFSLKVSGKWCYYLCFGWNAAVF